MSTDSSSFPLQPEIRFRTIGEGRKVIEYSPSPEISARAHAFYQWFCDTCDKYGVARPLLMLVEPSAHPKNQKGPGMAVLMDDSGRITSQKDAIYLFATEEAFDGCLTDKELAAIGMHELGHLALKHLQKRFDGSNFSLSKQEIEADKFAVKHLDSPQDYLEMTIKMKKLGELGEDSEHLPPDERVKKVADWVQNELRRRSVKAAGERLIGLLSPSTHQSR